MATWPGWASRHAERLARAPLGHPTRSLPPRISTSGTPAAAVLRDEGIDYVVIEQRAYELALQRNRMLEDSNGQPAAETIDQNLQPLAGFRMVYPSDPALRSTYVVLQIDK